MSERRQERKIVTVLFCDLAGFTRRAEEMDPEDVASLLEPYQARVKHELERHGGTVEKFIGDAVMALFGAPITHEDDPERALRAAFAIREFARTEGMELRIGIATGEALVLPAARPEQGETMATGDVVNTAARIQAAGPVNGILVSARTHQSTRDRIEYREAEPVEAKGKAHRVPVWEAVSLSVPMGAQVEAPFVGRESDLRLLEDALVRVDRERSCQFVTLVGVPGIGKSRLLLELEMRRGDVTWRHGRCLPYGDGITFWALGEIVKAQVGVLESDSSELAETKLERAVPDDDWVRESLRPLVGLSVEGVVESDRREQAFGAWRRFVEGVAEAGTLVLVFEDVHWADDDLLDFVDHLVDWASSVALLVVCTTRPELLERRQGWAGSKTNALTFSLSPLSDDETASLIGYLADRAVMPAEAQAALLARAGGNPLYAQQYVRMIEERGVADATVPETVQGIVAARLDLLPPEHKALLQDAAVLGTTFSLSALTAIAGLESRAIETTLHVLERKGFVRRVRQSSLEADPEYAFLHVLVEEVAYGQLPRPSRIERHVLAARWIESLGRPEDRAETLAYHYGTALELGRLAGVDTSPFEAPARIALRDAGDRAFALHAYAQALRLYERALDLSTELDAERPQLLFLRAKAHFLAVEGGTVDLLEEAREGLLASGDLESAAEAEILEARQYLQGSSGSIADSLPRARSAVARLRDAPPSPAKAHVLANGARIFAVAGSPDEGLVVARNALQMAEELELGELRANALSTIGMARLAKRDFAGLDDLEDSLRLTVVHGTPDELMRGYNNLAWSYANAGRWARASDWWMTQLEAAERFGLRPRWAKASLVLDGYVRGRWDEAVRLADELLAGESSTGVEPFVLKWRSTIRLARDDTEGAADDFSDLSSHFDEAEDSVDPIFLLWLARTAFDHGRREQAAELAGHVLDRSAEWFQIRPDLELLDVAWLVAELDLRRDPVLDLVRGVPESPWYPVAVAIATGELASAADQLSGFGAPAFEAYARLRAAERLVAEGRRMEANEQLRTALAFYRSVGATRSIREGEELLAATA